MRAFLSFFRQCSYFIIGLALVHSKVECTTQLFANTLSLAQFGAISNTVASLQPSANMDLAQSTLRTNDFQNLQLNYQNYATARSIDRLGAFLISQNATASASWPGGPGVTFPALRYSNDPVNNPANPALNITTNNTTSLLVFTANETTSFNLATDLGQSSTRQTVQLLYANPSNSAQYIKDYCVIGSAFHDILYDGLTPVIWADGFTHLVGVTVFSAAYPMGQSFPIPSPPNGFTLPSGNKFKLTLLDTTTNQTQTWLLYLQPPDSVTPTLPELVFTANYNGSAPNLLVAQSPFNGFVRVGIIQTTPVPFAPQPSPTPTEVAEWSTALGIQTIAPSPAGMFMLWPSSFTATAKTKVEYNFANQIDLPYCPWLSIYLPVVACTDFSTASNYFYNLVADIPPPAGQPYPFDGGTNPFLSFLYMLLGSNYASDIATYQTSQRPFPSYGITATDASVESVYDTYRDAIPTSAEVAFGTNSYNWTYSTIFRQGASQTQPLIIFPGYKTLTTPSAAVAGFAVQDPIKGTLYATATSGNQAFFKEGPLPTFLTTQFFPSDFWTRIGSANQTTLMKYLNQALANQALAGNILAISPIPDGYGNGKVLYQAAETILYGTALMQQQGMSATAIKTATKPTVDAIKSVIEDWLINIQSKLRQQQGGGFPSPFAQNFFIGDSTVGGGGVCYSIRGMLGGSDSVTVGQDFGNAFYNDHHFAYGYWLGAAAAVIEWDNTMDSLRLISKRLRGLQQHLPAGLAWGLTR